MEEKIAHGKGTPTPAIPGGNTYLFAHSKNEYNGSTPEGAWFTRIDELNEGDLIYIHYHSKDYTYVVRDTFTVTPEKTNVYTATSPFEYNRSLTLQTCYPRGDISGRLIVLAEALTE